jgi:hypothetical protein
VADEIAGKRIVSTGTAVPASNHARVEICERSSTSGELNANAAIATVTAWTATIVVCENKVAGITAIAASYCP